jgi:glutathione S-transferase
MMITSIFRDPFPFNLRGSIRALHAMFSRVVMQQAISHLSDALTADIGLQRGDEAITSGARMRLYYAPGACSLASHISLREAGLPFQMTMVDIRVHKTDEGEDYRCINPKGYVPALFLGTGQPLTENVAILSFIADQAPHLMPEGAIGRVRLIEILAFIASEIHKPFIGVMFTDSDAMRGHLKEMIGSRLMQLDAMSDAAFLSGQRFTTADAYFYVMARWARMLDVDMPMGLARIAEHVENRPAVQAALKAEGLTP